MSDTFSCPRRSEIGSDFSVFKYSTEDKWMIHAAPMSKPNLSQYRSCSYCGSMHPEDFLKFIEEDWIVIPTDKNYKVYIEKHSGKLIESSGMEFPEVLESGKFYYQHLSSDQAKQFYDLWKSFQMKIGPPGNFYVLPYFIKKKA
jgi:hypothetical protein